MDGGGFNLKLGGMRSLHAQRGVMRHGETIADGILRVRQIASRQPLPPAVYGTDAAHPQHTKKALRLLIVFR